MSEFTPRSFGYSHSYAVMNALKYHVKYIKGSYIGEGYDFIEKPGEHKAFDAMIELAKQGGRDMLYVESIKEFAGNSLTDLKDALTAIHEAGMLIESQRETTYNYIDFMTLLRPLEELMPEYQKHRQQMMAVGMAQVMDIDIKEICERTGLSEADVFQAVADYKRQEEREQAEE